MIMIIVLGTKNKYYCEEGMKAKFQDNELIYNFIF